MPALLVLITACAGSGSGADTTGTQEPLPGVEARVIRVEDGDTAVLSIDGTPVTLRLLGVNAPEQGECAHDEAASTLERLLGEGSIRAEERGTDQFARTLAYLWAGGRFVNLALVAEGMAIATTPEPEDGLGVDVVAAEEEAYEAGVGLWDDCDAAGSADLEMAIDTTGHDPQGPDEEVLSEEVVTISNLGSASVDLTGWTLRDESSSHRFHFPQGAAVPAGGMLGIASSDPGWDPGDSPVWSNAGDVALLLDADGGVVSRARYQSG